MNKFLFILSFFICFTVKSSVTSNKLDPTDKLFYKGYNPSGSSPNDFSDQLQKLRDKYNQLNRQYTTVASQTYNTLKEQEKLCTDLMNSGYVGGGSSISACEKLVVILDERHRKITFPSKVRITDIEFTHYNGGPWHLPITVFHAPRGKGGTYLGTNYKTYSITGNPIYDKLGTHRVCLCSQ